MRFNLFQFKIENQISRPGPLRVLAGIYAQGGVFGLPSSSGIIHTTVVLRCPTCAGGFTNSLTGFGGGNIYAATSVCHQMTNQAFMRAGFANTVASISGSGFGTYASTMLYGPYGSVGTVQGYIEARKR